MWLQDKSCLKLIHDSWDNKVVGCPMFILQHKLKRLKIEIYDWNKNSFGNVHNVVLLKQDLLLGIQQTLETASMSDIDGLLCQEKIARRSLIRLFTVNICFGKKGLRCFGLKMGIEILFFFHVVVKRRNNSSGIHRLQIDNVVIEDPKLIEEHILDFYKTLYVDVQDTSNIEDFIGTYIPELVSSEENMMLIKCLDFLKIKNAIFNLNGNSAPGPYGFGGVFYHSCWKIIVTDVCNVVKQFFKQKWVLPGMNTNVVSLIPKIQGAEFIKHYRPIVVANFKFKIIFNILADQLAFVAAKIISPNQYEFVQSRKIQDCTGIASEAIKLLSKKVHEGNVAYKVDIHKAFDTLSWNFLLLVLFSLVFTPCLSVGLVLFFVQLCFLSE